MELFEKPAGAETRWISFENRCAGRGMAGLENAGAKGHAFDQLLSGETVDLLNVQGSGTVTRIWVTVNDRSPEMLRSLRLDMYWDGADNPAVSAPLGDFFGVGLGRKTAFENALFSDPEGRSFNCAIPMPFWKSARITLTNESDKRLSHLFYDVDLLMGVEHSEESLYFHAYWHREAPNTLGKEFDILPGISGNGRFLGCNLGVIVDPGYAGSWWGEGEVKVWFGAEENPTLCGTGTEDYIGTGWGQGVYSHRYQGCLIADKESRHYCFYRYHIPDPVYFTGGCRVAIQTIGGADKAEVITMQKAGMELIPISIDTGLEGGFTKLMDLPQPVDLESDALSGGWCNFWRRDDWSGTCYFYLDNPAGVLPAIQPVSERIRGLQPAAKAEA